MISTEADLDTADMRALQGGEDPALDRLMLRWQKPLRGFLYRHTQNESDAMDLAQETFLRVYQNRDRFRIEARFSTWLFQIALNLARDRGRRLTRRPSTALDDAPELVDSSMSPEVSSENAERTAAIRAAIAELPADLKEALILFEYEEKSHAEIAEIVDATPKAVETRIYRARQLLKKALTRWLA